ncbi:MAG: phage shock protein operon transcriptional activator [Bacteriovoracaceae bacterium]|nr:phage shock protein operon transcriptional activator [Bacteriovoracaceae bacterium]
MKENELIGESDVFHKLLDHVSALSKLARPVLVIGERGTGKELIAERIHYLSKVWDGPFIKLNCATLTPELLSSELFGHEAGSFTGAIKRHIGRFERARNGTIFLDEVAHTTLGMQEKILRVIEYGEFERIGGSDILKTNARIVAATNIDLPTACLEGKFREDLLDRLAFDVITIPPLRKRKGDILLLASHFAAKMSRELMREYPPEFSLNAQELLVNFLWPGNIRELKNVVERAVYKTAKSKRIVEHIQFDPFDSPYRPSKPAIKMDIQQASEESFSDNSLLQYAHHLMQTSPIDLKKVINEIEKNITIMTLQNNDYNQKKTAIALGITYDQLRGIIKKFKLQGSMQFRT